MVYFRIQETAGIVEVNATYCTCSCFKGGGGRTREQFDEILAGCIGVALLKFENPQALWKCAVIIVKRVFYGADVPSK